MYVLRYASLVKITCMQWLQDAFLGYFSNWEAGVQDRPGFTTAQKALMLLSKETREGLQMTGTYICSLRVSCIT